MYGIYDMPLSISAEGMSISIEKREGEYLYKREAKEESVEKSLFTKDCSVLINPVEPLNTPRDITPYLLTEFENKVFVEPEGISSIYITFPIDIGVFVGKRGRDSKDFQIIDVFSLYPGKYTLYGDIRTGILCKYYKSTVSVSAPAESPVIEGIMELKISNATEKWIEVSKAVFNAYLMKIYYSKTTVSMKAAMVIHDKNTAETSFIDSPLEIGMKKGVEHYISKGFLPTSAGYRMEWGL